MRHILLTVALIGVIYCLSCESNQFIIENSGVETCASCFPTEFGNHIVYGNDSRRVRSSYRDNQVIETIAYSSDGTIVPVPLTLSNASSSCKLNTYCGIKDGVPQCLSYSRSDCTDDNDCAPGQICHSQQCRVCVEHSLEPEDGLQKAYCFMDSLHLASSYTAPWLALVCDGTSCWPPTISTELFTILVGAACALSVLCSLCVVGRCLSSFASHTVASAAALKRAQGDRPPMAAL
ncbi:hypothetical protein J8273_3960 [Carpediemonas membranifera]|uniref:Uncharacterized protein n=1 Tax=Carpediemonas membranifera TaxID=201153 RepID=A0A8J6BYC3_9EUKA|nr:hypothetical protein J8273_3960 [Carpediemonas membranifera]|eukprot:KAG9394326.1 hypothetical protein J8273_3960 [Carpediemonas membranifera]